MIAAMILGGALVAVFAALMIFFAVLVVGEFVCGLLGLKFAVLMLKGVRRNPVRAGLSYLATFVLVFMVTVVWSVISFIDMVQTEKSADVKTIVTEKYQIPSQMPFSYSGDLTAEVMLLPPQQRPTQYDLMSWSFVAATLDPKNRTFDNTLFMFAMDPSNLLGGTSTGPDGKLKDIPPMMDDLDTLSEGEMLKLKAGVEAMQKDRRAILIGVERLKLLNKKVGETIQATCLNYKDLVFEYVIAGTLPAGSRYDQSTVMHREYLLQSLEKYKRDHNEEHPLAQKNLNLFWIRFPTRDGFQQAAPRIEGSARFSSPRVKMETASSGVGSFLEAYASIIWGTRWLFIPAALATMSLVIANAISISVRERRTEMAVLKVLGFGPNQVLLLVLGEAVLIGAISGFLSTAFTVYVVDVLIGGVPFPIAFFPKFLVPLAALWWGPVLGASTAFVGTIVPAWSARTVRVSEVFARVS
jgi:putative ABC transport system permease protein